MEPSDRDTGRVGIDTGGTFTDVVWLQDGRLMTAKVPSQPDSPSKAVISGLKKVTNSIDLVCHGTTVGTNAVLARHGGPACMVVTEGFRDVLELGRGERTELYSPSPTRPRPILDRDSIHEIDLRPASDGSVLSAPSEESISTLAGKIKESGARSVGIGILHSAGFPSEEQELAEKLQALTGLPVFPSSSLAAYPREYERWNLAAVAAYLAPVLGLYLAELSATCPHKLALMASSGGLISPDQVGANPALCILSGPAGGALAGMTLGRDRVLALDMGGTSTDVTLLAGSVPRTREAEIDGLPVPLPAIDIHTIGAGGGSIVKIDAGGMLALGPESAGAMPGPACYGNGGPATLSDVALVAGRLIPEHFLGGEMPLEKPASLVALENICPSGMDVDSLVDGIIDLAIVHLTGALRRISVARGIDPATPDREFTLVPFGGAGALFAVECARAIGLREVLHPRAAGVFSAIGLMQAPLTAEAERAILKRPSEAMELISSIQIQMKQEITHTLSDWSTGGQIKFTTTLECRYIGQTHTMEVEFRDELNAGMIIESFETAYEARYTYKHNHDQVEIVTIRVRGDIPAPSVDFADVETTDRGIEHVFGGSTRLRIDRKWRGAPVLKRDFIPIEESFDGPALIVEDFATLYLPPDCTMHLDRKGHAIIELV